MNQRLWATLLFSAIAVFATSARCIENDSMRKGPDGDWHIYGEIHNETDVQGSEIVVVGTLLDASGNEIGSGQAPVCPFELSPSQFSAYDIRIPNSETLTPSSYRINVLSGKALTEPLPQLDASADDLAASRSGDTVTITGSVIANRGYSGDFSGCAAFYDGAGAVIQHVTIFGFGGLSAGVRQDLDLPLPFVPDDAESVRFWLVGPSTGGSVLSSGYAAFISGKITIE